MEEVSLEATVLSAKRKAVAGSSHEEGHQSPDGWVDDSVGEDTASLDRAAIDKKTLDEVKPRPGRKHRLSKAEIRTILALRPRELPTTDYLDDLVDSFSPDWIEQRKRELEAEAEICRKLDEKSEEFRQQVIRSVVEKGYFEVDDEFLINREKANQRALEDWAKKDFGGLRFATEEEEAEMEAEWYPPYQLDEDDAAVLALFSAKTKMMI
jgi:hypothetical protein